MKALRLLCAVICLASYAAGEARASLITTFPTWNGSENNGPFGFGGTETIGQTFTVVGPDVVLNNYSVSMDDNSPTSFKTYVMLWSNALSHAVGPILFQATATTNNNGGAGGFQKFVFNTGHLVLTAGQTYVMFESISEPAFFSGANGTSQVATVSTPPNPYTGGSSFFLDNGGDTSQWTGVGWTFGGNIDLVFDATMSAPEPSSLALLGAAAICFVARRRRRLVQDAAVGSRD
jgi:hypothetical protein